MNLQTYLNIRHNLLVKRAGIGSWLFGHKSKHNSLPYLKYTNYAKTNPNISPELAARADAYRNKEHWRTGEHIGIPVGGEKYLSPQRRAEITSSVEGSVLPKTNEGAANVTNQRYSDFSQYSKYKGVKIKKPRRLDPRKRSIEDYYGERKARLADDVNSARRAADAAANDDWDEGSDALKALNSSLRLANVQVEANKQNEQMDAELARRQQWRQQQAHQRQQRAQQQRAQYRAQRQQQPMQQPMQQQPMQQQPMQQRPMQQPMQQRPMQQQPMR